MTGRAIDIETGDDAPDDAPTTGFDDTADDAADPIEGDVEGDAADPSPTGLWERWRSQRRNRISRWDRPPQPRDWRFFVGTFGKVLIVTGILMFGFVAYQLWGTGIETARAQNALGNDFERAVAAHQAPETDDTIETNPSGSVPDTTETDEPPTTTGEAPDTDTDTGVGVGGSAPSEVVPGGVDLSGDAVEQNVPVVAPGDAIAKIEIPRLGIDDLYVVRGVTLTDLKKGPGHYPDTPLPGQLGNAAVAGHRTTYGAPFFDVDQLEPGDEIIVTMVTGDRFVYAVTGLEIVTAADYWVITTRDPTVAELTLTTCHPKYTARDRLIVHSALVPETSAPVGVAEFWDAAETDTPSDGVPAGDDPTLVAPDQALDQAVDQEIDGDSSDDDRPSATFLDDEQPDAEPAEPELVQIDAFSEGWFHDRTAFSQIALWGAALAIISILAYQVSKRTRHSSFGVVVGIVPFLVALYFFYQNVNRLLPPGL